MVKQVKSGNDTENGQSCTLLMWMKIVRAFLKKNVATHYQYIWTYIPLDSAIPSLESILKGKGGFGIQGYGYKNLNVVYFL